MLPISSQFRIDFSIRRVRASRAAKVPRRTMYTGTSAGKGATTPRHILRGSAPRTLIAGDCRAGTSRSHTRHCPTVRWSADRLDQRSRGSAQRFAREHQPPHRRRRVHQLQGRRSTGHSGRIHPTHARRYGWIAAFGKAALRSGEFRTDCVALPAGRQGLAGRSDACSLVGTSPPSHVGGRFSKEIGTMNRQFTAPASGNRPSASSRNRSHNHKKSGRLP